MDRELLKTFGWSGGPILEPEPVFARMSDFGHLVFPRARELLLSYLGFEFRREPTGMPEYTYLVGIDPRDRIRFVEPETVDDFAHLAGSELTVVGELYDKQFSLLYSEDGGMYATQEGGLWKLGDDEVEVLVRLCRGIADFEPLLVPEGW